MKQWLADICTSIDQAENWTTDSWQMAGEAISACDTDGYSSMPSDKVLDLIGRLIDEVERLKAEVAHLSTPHLFWDDRRLESSYELGEIGEYDDIGDVIEVRPIHELPSRWAVCLQTGVELYDTFEEAKKAAEKAEEVNQ